MTYTPIDLGEDATLDDIIADLEESVTDAYRHAMQADPTPDAVRETMEQQMKDIKESIQSLSDMVKKPTS